MGNQNRARQVLEEAHRRAKAKLQARSRSELILAELFDKQIAFVKDPSRNKFALSTRRAGKSNIWPRYTVANAIENPRSLQRIWCITRLRAKQMFWSEFKWLFERHQMPVNTDDPNSVVMHDTELTIRFPNGAEIRLLGADKDKEVQKKRGDKTIMEVIVESQLYGPILRTLVEDVAEPCLFDLRGTMCMEGTPGPLCVGFWFEVSGRNDTDRQWVSVGGKDGVGAGWSGHRWSLLDNPHLTDKKTGQTAAQELEAIKAKKKWAPDNPTMLREYYAKWVNDLTALYYAYDEARNSFTLQEVVPWGPGWQHALGWDLGFRDDMALVIWGWHPSTPVLYEAFSWKKPGALAAEVMQVIEAVEKRGMDLVQQVADTGGGGRMYVEEVMSRYGRVFTPAKKTEKYEHVRLFNDALRSGQIKVQRGSPLEQELATLPIEPDWMPFVDGVKPGDEAPDRFPKEDSRYPNHCCDASLYSFRSCFHYLHTDAVKEPEPGTDEHEQQLAKDFADSLARTADSEWWDVDDGGLDGFEDDY